MDKILNSDLPWQLKMLLLLTAGLALAVVTLAIPQRAYVFIGRRFPWWSPTVTTIGRVIIFWVCMPGYFLWSTFWCFLGVVEGCILDVVDGHQATVYARHGIKRSEREERWGKTLDQLCDKLTVPPALVYLGHLGTISPGLSWAILAVDFAGAGIREIGTLGAWICRRRPSGNWNKFGQWLQTKHKDLTRCDKATSIGKIKALMQCFTLIACVPYHQGWVVGYHGVVNGIGIFTLFLGVLSILSRMQLNSSINSSVDWITDKFFTHVDIRQTLRTLRASV